MQFGHAIIPHFVVNWGLSTRAVVFRNFKETVGRIEQSSAESSDDIYAKSKRRSDEKLKEAALGVQLDVWMIRPRGTIFIWPSITAA